MTGHRARAVRASRVEPASSLDYFGTPPWGTRALCRYILDQDWLDRTAADPACGEGYMARPMAEYFDHVVASDISDHGYGAVRDFLSEPPRPPVDWIITNPPFARGLPAKFARQALAHARHGVALLVQTRWTECDERYQLFSQYPPAVIAQFMGRLACNRGAPQRGAGTATAYCWVVWRRGDTDTRWRMIPPTAQAELERWGDYQGEEGASCRQGQ